MATLAGHRAGRLGGLGGGRLRAGGRHAGVFDGAFCLDVLEHIQDDAALVRSFAGILPEGGTLFVKVPAHQWLYGSVDEAATLERRQAIRTERGWTQPPLYGLGAAREAHSALWTQALEDAIAEAVAVMPVQLKQFLHRRLMDGIAQRLEDGRGVVAGDVPGLLADLQAGLENGRVAAE